eukprot:SAG31_NODE_2659_length_5284_cov_6.942152_4_plen_87_part_00
MSEAAAQQPQQSWVSSSWWSGSTAWAGTTSSIAVDKARGQSEPQHVSRMMEGGNESLPTTVIDEADGSISVTFTDSGTAVTRFAAS